MHVGGIYFINHKTKYYFPEGAGLLNLSVSTLKEQNSHDSQLFSGDTHYNREDYHRKHPAETRRPGESKYRKNKYSRVLNRDVHGTSTGPSCGKSMGPNDGTF